MKSKLTRNGFTIVELVIVIAVIAILAAVLIPTFSSLIQKAKQSADTQNLRNINTTIALEKATSSNFGLSDAVKAVYNSGYNLQVKDDSHIYAFNKATSEFEYVKRGSALTSDYEVLSEVNELSELESAVENGGIIYLKGSFNLNDSVDKKYLHVTKDLVVVGDSTNITVPNNAKDTSGIAYWKDQTSPLFVIESDDVVVTLCGLNMNGTSESNSLVATAANNTTVNLFNCTLTGSNYAVNIRNYGEKAKNRLASPDTQAEDAKVNVYIKNCTINANLSALNIKYVGGNITVEDSVLTQTRTGDYALVANEGNGVNIKLINCTLSPAGDDIISTQFRAKNTTVELVDCSCNDKHLTISSDAESLADPENKIIVNGVLTESN